MENMLLKYSFTQEMKELLRLTVDERTTRRHVAADNNCQAAKSLLPFCRVSALSQTSPTCWMMKKLGKVTVKNYHIKMLLYFFLFSPLLNSCEDKCPSQPRTCPTAKPTCARHCRCPKEKRGSHGSQSKENP